MGVRQLLGQIANERGKVKEKWAVEACQGPLPAWFRSARAGTHEEDSRGIDLVADTDVGDIYIQIKSSRTGKEAFKEKGRKNIGVVILRMNDPMKLVRDKIVSAVGQMRSAILKSRSGVTDGT